MKITKSFLLLGIIFLNICAPSSAFAGESQVILDQLLTGDVPQLNANDIKIPDDLKPGFHELQVEVLDDSGVVSSKTALFCKDLKGELHFDNNCPDLLVTSTNKVFRSSYKPYDPKSDPVGTAEIALVAFAVASTVVGFGSNKYQDNLQDGQNNDEDSMGDLGSVAAAKLSENDIPIAWGDRRWYINTRFFNSFDSLATSSAKIASRFSGLLGRAILDARYLRAIIGNFTWMSIPAALVVCFIGLNQIENQALPLEFLPLVILMCLGIFDALAGFFGAFLYLNFIFANGNFDSKEAVFTGLGVSLIFFAPGLIASKFRPLTRNVKDFSSLWERGTDYVLASLLTGWSVSKLINALPGLSKLDLPIVEHANQIGVIAGSAVALRLLLEEIAWYLYPARLSKLTTVLKKPGLVQDIREILFKTGIFYLLAEPYIGFNKYLLAGCIVFTIPQLLGLVQGSFPKFNILDQIIPRGAFKIVLFSFISIFAVNYLKTLELSPGDFILTSFVFLPLPPLLFAILDMFSGQRPFDISKNHRFRLVYRISGLIILGILILIVLGLDPYIESKNFILNIPNLWADFLRSLASVWSWFSDQIELVWNWTAEHLQQIWNWVIENSLQTWNWTTNQFEKGWFIIRDEWIPNIKYHIYHPSKPTN